MLREEGLGSFYNSLPPRLVSVVPMIGLQYGTYEFIKRFLAEGALEDGARARKQHEEELLEAEEVALE